MASAVRKSRVPSRWLRLPVDRVAAGQGCYFDQDAADHVCNFFEQFLRHTTTRKWAGRPFLLEGWQRDFLSRLYGWKRPDGTRRYREAYLEVPKKNGKSTLLSGLALYGMFEEPGAEVYPGAVNSKQAAIIYREACRMIGASARLKRHLQIKAFNKTITFPGGNSRLEVLSADADSKDGANASHTILDEVHRFANRKLYDVMKYAGTARDQPLLTCITTAGSDRFSLCWELHQQARAILDGATEDTEFLGVIFGADAEKDDLDDPLTWAKANPSLGIIISPEDFAKEYAQAKRIPGRLNNFLRLRLGVWTEQATRWLPMDLWDAGADPVPISWWQGRPCYAAIDISSVSDLTALTLLSVEGADARIACYFFMPEDTAERRAEVDGVPYPRWIGSGHMLQTPGNATDHEAIRRTLNDLAASGVEILKVGMDPWNAAHLANELMQDGFDVEMIRQGFPSLTAPSKELERRLLNGTLKHDANPCQRWCVGNVAVEHDASGNIRPSKKRSTERIDGVVSLVMALGLAMNNPDFGPPSITILSPGS